MYFNRADGQMVYSLEWSEKELKEGKQIRLNDFPEEHKRQLFRDKARKENIQRNHIGCASMIDS